MGCYLIFIDIHLFVFCFQLSDRAFDDQNNRSDSGEARHCPVGLMIILIMPGS